ncbi:MAG: hypothetical protein LPJ89_00995 [Hymenobacteraceae bacterium]|nr:hypothetical protein [Hymenobacteraceae bacterium]MDX5442339.1 hypothetical protein [Hymenobacteraceae bacterium]
MNKITYYFLPLCLVFFFSCKKEDENPSIEPLKFTYEAEIDGKKVRTSEGNRSYSDLRREIGSYYTYINSPVIYDSSQNSFSIQMRLAKYNYLTTGTYTLPTDSVFGSVYITEAGQQYGRSWITGKNTSATLTITEFKREPITLTGMHPYTRISGNISFIADTSHSLYLPTTGTKTVKVSFENMPLNIINEFPNFHATVDQTDWEGDARMEWIGLSNNFYLRAYNYKGEKIYIDYPDKIREPGTYKSSSASFFKRMPDGSFKNYYVSGNTTFPTYDIIIDKVDKAKNTLSGRATIKLSSPQSNGTSDEVTIVTSFTDVSATYTF